MTRWIAAAVAIVAAGIGGAMFVPGADAQPVPESETKIEVVEIKPEVVEPVVLKPEVVKPVVQWVNPREHIYRNARTGPIVQSLFAGSAQQPGTWQIISHKDTLLLLNTASGDTFRLGEGNEGPEWKPIPRPTPLPTTTIPHHLLPDPSLLPWDHAEKQARREVEKRNDQRRDQKQLAEFEKTVSQIESELNDIAKKLNDAGPDERAKLRDQRRELEKKLDDLERQLKDMRRDR